ncbi:MAG: [protein-PII] uridylyltransferase [Verrucomicrobiales bacterium]|nr:[protein-PII] uridylyltransferase [Verrucomicrobiales bacterium]
MNALIARIEANANRRLRLPSGRKPSEELPRYRAFLKEETARLRILHRSESGGAEVCKARADMMDILIRHLFDSVRESFPPKGRPPRLALVAYGGYGRAELNPYSDIDLMFLHDGRRDAETTLGEWTSGLLYTLWDVGLKVGHALRTVDDCVKVANQDMQSKTALMEARLITGDEPLFKSFQKAFATRCIANHEDEYIGQRLEDQVRRRDRHGNSAAMQEPHVKNGCGGLRDYQNLLWMASVKLGYRSLPELQAEGYLGSRDRKTLEAAYDFLLRTRNELHYSAGSAMDVLTAAVKPAVATGLGYTERSPRLRVEHFMRDYYTHARNVYLITRLLEQRLALVPTPVRGLRALLGRRTAPPPTQEVDGFRIIGQQITAPSRTIFREDPNRLIRAFLYAQRRGLTLHPDLVQMLRLLVQEGRVDGAFVRDAGVHATFLEILAQRGNVAPALRAMHEVGFLGRLIPEFGRLTNLVQHEFYHQYAVDEHTLVALSRLDRVAGATESPYANYAPLFQQVERPEVLYLALLLHDAGKAIPGRPHELVGGELAVRASRRLQLDGATTHVLRKLIELHLELVKVSQRRDLEDPAVIRQVADEVQDTDTLTMLTLHTFADSMGTSDTLWNGFKDSLLRTLYHKTRDCLAGGTEFIRATRKVRELLRDEVVQLLPKTFVPDEIDAHFQGMPSRYFLIHDARAVARDLTLAHRFMHLQLTEAERALEPALLWHDEPDRGYTAVHICTWDRTGLFAKLTGALAAAGLNILAAQIYTRKDGIVLDDFFVVDARTGKLPESSVRQRFEKIVIDVLARGQDPARALAKAQQYPPLYRAVGERMPTTIRFDNQNSEDYTILDVEAEDRVGLLFALAATLHDLQLDIGLAKIVTEKGAAIDTFYITGPDGEKIGDEDRQRVITRRIREAVA